MNGVIAVAWALGQDTRAIESAGINDLLINLKLLLFNYRLAHTFSLISTYRIDMFESIIILLF